MPPIRVRTVVRRLAAVALAAAVALPAVAAAQQPVPLGPAEREALLARNRAFKQAQVEMLRQRFRTKLEKRKANAKLYRRAAKKGQPLHMGLVRRPVTGDPEGGATPAFAFTRSAAPGAALGTSGTTAIPGNIRANDPAGDPAGACQSEQAVAAWGSQVMIAWNDGGTGSGQGVGYSTNGGLGFTDAGDPPAIPGGGLWFSDPVMTVNEATGEFWYCGLFDRPSGASAVGVVRGTIAGNVLTWDTPVVPRQVDGISKALDKQWMVVDSLTGNLYLTYTLFTTTEDSIQFQRSTDGGATWSPAINLSSNAAAGLVQGSRVAVGPDGEVYATWAEIGTVDTDFIRIRRSDDGGVSFGAEQTAMPFYSNFGGGAPGFNRERGISFPSIAVDRTDGPNRGRVYVALNESLNYFDDPIFTIGAKSSVENDNFFNRANPFTVNNILRGTLSNNDLDYFSFTANAGVTYLFYCDSIPRPLYTLRVFCGQDTLTRLAYAGDLFAPAGGAAIVVWTAPATGTYYLRMAWVAGGTQGNYRIYTSVMNNGGEPGRDQRDAVVAWSDDGATWSSRVRVNDDLGRFDNWLPEVSVGADGCPYVTWFDWRDHACGGRSHQYMTRSDDGGATWLANQRLTDAQTPWTTVLSNLAPNQGDYSHMYSDERYVRTAWADGRDGTPDVYTARVDTWFDLLACSDDTTVTVSPGNPAQVDVAWNAANRNPLFGNDYTYELSDERGWPLPAPGNASAAAAGSFGGLLAVAVPDTAAPGVNTLRLKITNARGTRQLECPLAVTVTGGPVAVGDGAVEFALLPASPNPARGASRLAFTLPRAGEVRLEVYGLQGQRVRTLARGAFGAGLHTLAWDGRDDDGRIVPAGAYFVRLEGLGRRASQRVVWMR